MEKFARSRSTWTVAVPVPLTPYDQQRAYEVITASMKDYQTVYGGPAHA